MNNLKIAQYNHALGPLLLLLRYVTREAQVIQ